MLGSSSLLMQTLFGQFSYWVISIRTWSEQIVPSLFVGNSSTILLYVGNESWIKLRANSITLVILVISEK